MSMITTKTGKNWGGKNIAGTHLASATTNQQFSVNIRVMLACISHFSELIPFDSISLVLLVPLESITTQNVVKNVFSGFWIEWNHTLTIQVSKWPNKIRIRAIGPTVWAGEALKQPHIRKQYIWIGCGRGFHKCGQYPMDLLWLPL